MRVATAVFCIAVAIHVDLHAQSIPVEIEISDLQAARLLIKVGRLKDARVFLEQFQPQNEEEWTERLFLLGRIAVSLGEPEEAIDKFEEILGRRPNLTRVHLELAAAYYAAGIDDKAKFHFRSSLAQNLPLSVESVVDEYLRRINARKRWSASFSFSLLPESNPSRRTEQRVISVGGLPFHLNNDSRPSSGVGGLVSSGVSFSPIIADNIRGLVAVSGAAKIYERSEWNDIRIVTDFGFSRFFRKGSTSMGLRVGRQWTGGERTRKSLGLWIRNRWRKSESVLFEIPTRLEYHKYDRQSYRDGWQFSISPGFNVLLNPRTVIGVEPLLELVGANEKHHQKRVVGLGLGFQKSFENGFSFSINPSFHWNRYVGEDPLFGVKRMDKKFILSIGASHRTFQYKGFTPTSSYVYERNKSNIPVRTYHNHGVNISITRTF